MDYSSIFENYDYFDKLVAEWEQKNGKEFPFTQSEMDGISECYFQYQFDMEKFDELFEQLDKASQDKFMFNFLYEKGGIVDFVDEEDFEQDPTHHMMCTDKNGGDSYIAIHQNRFSYDVWVENLANTLKNTFDIKLDESKNGEELFQEVIEKTCHLTNAGKLHDKLNNEVSEKPITKAQKLSNDIEGENFSYKIPTTRTTRAKL